MKHNTPPPVEHYQQTPIDEKVTQLQTTDLPSGVNRYDLSAHGGDVGVFSLATVSLQSFLPGQLEAIGLPSYKEKTLGIITKHDPNGPSTVYSIVNDRYGETFIRQLREDTTRGVEPRVYWGAPQDETAVVLVLSQGKQYIYASTSQSGGVRSSLIRPKMTDGERREWKAVTPTARDKYNRLRRVPAGLALAAAGFALTSIVNVVPESQDPAIREITSVSQIAGDFAEHTRSGRPQAEQYFDPETVLRVRKAAQAYMDGDFSGLENMRSSLGYESDWIPTSAHETIQTASSFDELKRALNTSVSETDVIFHVYADDLDSAPRSYSSSVADELSGFDIEQAKQSASELLSVLAQIDKREFDKKPVDIYLTGKIIRGTEQLGGYEVTKPSGKRSITIDVTNSSGVDSVMSHELVHALSDGNNSSPMVLVPSTVPGIYLGSGYEGSSTVIDHQRIFERDYGRKNPDEHLATAGESLFVPQKGRMELDDSVASEITMSLVFQMEQRYPGFAASFFMSTQPKLYRTSLFDAAAYTANFAPKLPSVGFGIASSIGLAAAAFVLQGKRDAYRVAAERSTRTRP